MTAELEGLSTGSLPNLRADTFELDKTFRTNPSAMVFGIVGKKGEPAREVNFEAGEIWTQDHYNRMEEDYKNGVLKQLRRLAEGDKLFFRQIIKIDPTNKDISGARMTPSAEYEYPGFSIYPIWRIVESEYASVSSFAEYVLRHMNF